VTDDIVEADSGESSVEVVAERTTAPAHHPSTVVLAAATLARIGVRADEIVRVSTGDEYAYAVAETDESTGIDVGTDELLTGVPVFSQLFCGPRERVEVSRASLPEANHFTVVPVDPATTSVLKRCSVTSAGLVDTVAHDGGIVEFRPADLDDDDPAGPYYAEVVAVCPGPPARVTADTRVDVRVHDSDERPQGVLSSAERRELFTTNLNERSADGDLRVRLRDRLETSLSDLRLLAERLPDDDLERVFGGDDDGASRTTGVATDAVALCWLGFDLADDEPIWRVEQAIERALYARGEDGEVDLRVTRQERPPAATTLDRIRRYGPDALDTYGTLEHLWTSPAVDSYELYDVTRDRLGEDVAVPPAELILERLAYRAQARRFPAVQLVSILKQRDDDW
jgi:hypothetical protein